MRLANWYFLLMLPLVWLAMYWPRKAGSLPYSSVSALKSMGLKKSYKQHLGKAFLAAGLSLLVLGLARPQISEGLLPKIGEGIDIAMVLDVSGSMNSVDLEPTRLDVAKDTIETFLDRRVEDRVGLVVFGGSAYTRVPLTLDHEVVQQSLALVTSDSVSEEGTAIGMAISVGMNRLKKSEASSKVMILVTDGDNNVGAIDPMTASNLAADMDIKVYTIGVGTDQTVLPYSYFGQTRYKTYEGGLNEALLQAIADITGGRYYRATDASSFEAIFNEIDTLEKSDFERDAYQQYRELSFPLMQIGLMLLVIGMYFGRYRYIEVP